NVSETDKEKEDKNAKRVRRRALNDAFRTTFRGGRVVMTAGVNALADAVQRVVFRKIQAFDAFDDENDPWGEHDFVSVEHDGQTFFAKIDLYERAAVKHYSIAKPLLVSRPPAAGRRFRIVRSWPCASAHRLVSGESAQAPSSHNQYSRMPSPENTGGEPNYYWAASSHQSSR